eukprot:CAMPEP_0114555316 /NCGR_PEP_ID=MMETSP0114-20121206/8684_1 /TAXON_ID=31324 /ORGANISM="Goniomonas sp, Strain m" /LENGTH=269 /DNA_ID=CAMNT_0001740433 /DNA_START=8 /DNA_END=817 /DNA_ORIENTATION=+
MASAQRECAACGESRGVDEYSKKQWTAKAHSRRCKPCVEAGKEATPSVQGAKVSGQDEEELCALLKAIMFAHPEFTVQEVHREVLSKVEKWEDLPLGKVKNLLKKLELSAYSSGKAQGEVLKFWTVGMKPGEGGSAAAVTNGEPLGESWVPVELNVPAIPSGSAPFQALLSSTKSKPHAASSSLVKIQTAGGAPPGSPMLLYNADKSQKTFIHPDSSAFRPLERLVKEHGICGAQGPAGGLKAFFRSQLDATTGALWVDTSSPAPGEAW